MIGDDMINKVDDIVLADHRPKIREIAKCTDPGGCNLGADFLSASPLVQFGDLEDVEPHQDGRHPGPVLNLEDPARDVEIVEKRVSVTSPFKLTVVLRYDKYSLKILYATPLIPTTESLGKKCGMRDDIEGLRHIEEQTACALFGIKFAVNSINN
ncbi:hypothetical protein Trydic_g1140 [Trypoxylus dichotomus]